MRKTRAIAPVLFVLAIVAGTAAPAPAQQGDLASRRREAQRLESEIEARAGRMSAATEDYNEASVERERLDARIAKLRQELDEAEREWDTLRTRLGERARIMYMHPGLWAEPYLSARNLGEMARARTLSGAVVMNDQDLLLQTERARDELERSEQDVASARALARDKEREMRSRQAVVEREVTAYRASLSRVNEDISGLVAAERARREAESLRRAEVARESSPRPSAGARPSATPSIAGRAPGSTPAPAKQVDESEKQARPAGPVRPGAAKAVQTAAAQMGKPYQWGAAGPDSYDCSGLTQYAWKAAGVSLPHSSRAQYSSLPKVSKEELQPGDLVFFGNPIHHVGIYEGNGIMINAPQTGDNVKRSSIHRKDYTGAARP